MDILTHILGEERNRMIYDHYGVDEKDFNRLLHDMFVDVIRMENKQQALDKHFGSITLGSGKQIVLDGEFRLKVHAYHIAMMIKERMKTKLPAHPDYTLTDETEEEMEEEPDVE